MAQAIGIGETYLDVAFDKLSHKTYSLTILTSPPSPSMMMEEALPVGVPSQRTSTAWSTALLTSGAISANPAGVVPPEMFAEVETSGLPNLRSKLRQKSWSGTRTANVPSSGMRFFATPQAPGKMSVNGLSAHSSRSQATAGTRLK